MKILIVDDHVLIREALHGVLKQLVDDAEILEAPTRRRARQVIEENPDLDLVLLDLRLPDGDGLDLLATLRATSPATSVVVLAASTERQDIVHALDGGAVGFIPKSSERDVMLSAFRLILSGGVYVPPDILGPRPAAATARPSPPRSAGAIGLTERQLEVLTLMMLGKSNKAICRELGVAEPTVKNHVTAILKALKATNRTEAVIAATALGLGRQSEP